MLFKLSLHVTFNLISYYILNSENNHYVFLRNDAPQGSRVGFSSQLCFLVDTLDMPFTAQFMEDFVSGLNKF